jgi:hypothetical protein
VIAVGLVLLGTPVVVRCPTRQAAERIRHLWAPFVTGTAADRPARTLDVAGEPDPTDLASLNGLALAEADCFAAHAGVVARSGSAVAFPAASGTGKTTLTAACLLAGFDYVSDEALCVDYGTGTVVPYPKPLTLSGPSCRLLGIDPGPLPPAGEAALTAADLGAAVATPPVHLAHVLLLERRPGPPELVEVEHVAGMTALLGMSFNHWRRPADAFGLTASLARRARAWTLGYDDPLDAAALLTRLAG